MRQGDQVARVAAALYETGDDVPFLDIAHLPQPLLQNAAFVLVDPRPGNHALAALDGREVPQRCEQPLPQKPTAAGSHRPVHRVQQSRLARAGPQRIDQLQVAARRGIENQNILPLPKPKRVDVPERPAQFMAKIMEQTSRRTKSPRCGGRCAKSKSIKRRGLEVIAQGMFRSRPRQKLQASCSTRR